VYESFKQIGEIQRPFLGIQYSMNTQSASRLNRVPVGAVITEVVPDTPAERAGLERFDVILEIDGTKLDEDNTLAEVIARKKVGDRITMKIDRDGREITLSTTLEAAR
jgi:serine protease Do